MSLCHEKLGEPAIEAGASLVNAQTVRQFGFSPLHQLARSWVRRAYGGRDIIDDVIKVANIEPHDSIVDLGCGNGSFLYALADRAGNTGPKIGLELSGDTVAMAQLALVRDNKDDPPNIEIMQADIQEPLPLRRNSVNFASLFNVIYHVGEPVKAAEKAYKIVQPGETVVVVTKDVGDLGKAWKWVGELAPKYFEEKYPGKYPDMKPPVPFYANCDLKRTLDIFDSRFERLYPLDAESPDYIAESVTKLKIQGDHAWGDYMYVLLSICEELIPDTKEGAHNFSRECRQFLQEAIKPMFDAELAEKGYVEDEAKQFILVYKKPEKKYFNVLRTLGLVNNHPLHSRPELLQAAARAKFVSVGKKIISLTRQNETDVI